jgi:hypothetical protein
MAAALIGNIMISNIRTSISTTTATGGTGATGATGPSITSSSTANYVLTTQPVGSLIWLPSPQVVTAATRPTVPYTGQMIYETDTKVFLQYLPLLGLGTGGWVLPFAQCVGRVQTAALTITMTVSSIPQYGTGLHFRGRIRSTRTTNFSNTGCRFQLNGNTTSVYSGQINPSGIFLTQPFGYMGQCPAEGVPSAPAGEFGPYEAYIPNYSSSNSIVSINTTGGGFSGGTPVIVCNIYAPASPTAITSVTVRDDNSDNLAIGSTLEVWIEM